MSLPCLPRHSHQQLVQSSDARRMALASQSLVRKAIIIYNRYMGGVDSDQLRGYYNCKVKSRKFYKYIFYFLFDVSITNAFILYKNFCSSPTFNTIKKFRLQLVSELIGEYTTRRRAGPGGGVIRPLPLQHFPLKVTRNHLSRKGRGDVALVHSTRNAHRHGFVENVVCFYVTRVTPTLTAF